MGALSQAEINVNAVLHAKWLADPAVDRFSQEAEAFAWRNNLKFNVEGMNAMFAFAREFQAEHGHLPPSGVKAA